MTGNVITVNTRIEKSAVKADLAVNKLMKGLKSLSSSLGVVNTSSLDAMVRTAADLTVPDFVRAARSVDTMTDAYLSLADGMADVHGTSVRLSTILSGMKTHDFSWVGEAWSEQVDELTESFDSLDRMAGNVIVSALEPFAMALDQGIQKLTGFAAVVVETFRGGGSWDELYQGMDNFGTNLADFLNGLLTAEDFGMVGVTISNGLNAAITAAMALGGALDFSGFGTMVAEGVSQFFATFDYAAFAETLDVWVQGLWSMVWTALSNVSWEELGNGLSEFISELDIETVSIIIGALTVKKNYSNKHCR